MEIGFSWVGLPWQRSPVNSETNARCARTTGISDHYILLIQHRHYAIGHSYWLLPGGGLEGDETPEACVQREIREETHLHVEVGQHLSLPRA